MTAADPHIQIAPEARKPVLSTVMPGRRALGEDWNRVDVYWSDEKRDWEYVITPTERPADDKAITVVSGMTGDMEMVDFILERHVAESEERKKRGQAEQMSPQEWYAFWNKQWHDWVEFKRRNLAGQSSFGAGGNYQREKVYQRK